MNDKYYITLKPFDDDTKNGVPAYINMMYTDKFNAKKPMAPIYNTDWVLYSPKCDGVPVPQKFKLPEHVKAVCKSIKRMNFDLYTQEKGEWLISSDFLNFIKEQKAFENQYEVRDITFLNTKGEEIVNKKQYYLLRFFKYDDEVIDWDKSKFIISKKDVGRPYNLYTELAFVNYNPFKLLYFSKIAFWRSFIVHESIKETFEKNFVGVKLYSLDEFVKESQKRIEYFNYK